MGIFLVHLRRIFAKIPMRIRNYRTFSKSVSRTINFNILREFGLSGHQLRDVLEIQGRFFGLVTISNQATQQIGQEVDRTAMSGVFNLRDIFALINDGFDNGALSQ